MKIRINIFLIRTIKLVMTTNAILLMIIRLILNIFWRCYNGFLFGDFKLLFRILLDNMLEFLNVNDLIHLIISKN